MAVLYRKYRPQTFEEVLNQKYIIQTLKNQVATGQVAHAYLFTGTRGVGKTSVARILAKALNCEENVKRKAKSEKWDGDACGQCSACKQIEQGNFLDLVEIDAASNTGVDNIRELIEHVKFSPSVGAYKVFIIDEVHMLSKGAFNALLKTLEEPPKHAVFILATTEINKVPATIISRTQRFDFKRLSPEDLESQLEKILQQENIKLPKTAVQLVAQNAEGSVRDSLSLLDKVLTLGESVTLEDCEQLLGITDIGMCENLLEMIASGLMAGIPGFFEQQLEKGADLAVFNRDFLEYLRKVLIFKITGERSLEDNHQERLKEIGEKLSLSDLIFTIRLFLKSYKDLAASPSADIPLLLASLEAAAKKRTAQHTAIPGTPVAKQAQPRPQMAEKAVAPASASEPELESASDIPTGAPDITLAELEQRWPEVIAGVKKVNPALANVVKNFSLLDAAGGIVTLGVKYEFHKQNLENQKNQALLRKVLEEVCGKILRVRGSVVRQDAAGKPAATEALADALKIFGGEVIE